MELIKTEIDCGRPVIALGVFGPPEACIVTGYKNGGETLLGWSLFQGGGDFSDKHGIDESGYFIKDNWWENTEGIMAVGEDIGEFVAVKEILENALMIMTQENVKTYEGSCLYHCGQAAYEAWAKAIENDTYFLEGANITERGYCHGDAETMLVEGRDFAAAYINSLANTHPALSHEFSECAELLKAASSCVHKMWEMRGGWEKND